MDDNIKKILLKLQAQCSRREYCTRDIREKACRAVSKLGMDDAGAAAGEIVESLVKDRFVDDLRFSCAFAREKSSVQGWGPEKIRYMLRCKGIGPEIISAALAEISPEAADKKLENVMRAKYRTVRECPDAALKMLRYGLGRGYSYDAVKAVTDRLLKESPSD